MDILFLTNKVPYPPKDGGSIATFGMIKAFADNGHKATVLAMNTQKHHITPFEIPDEVHAQITLHMVEVPALIKLKNLLLNLLTSKLPYNAERFIDKNYEHKLEQLLLNFSFDIIQLEGLYLCPYIPLIRKFSKAKIAYRSHNIEFEIWERTVKQTNGPKKIYLKHLANRLKRFEQLMLNSYDLLVPITERDEKVLNKLGNNKPSITIPAGFDVRSLSNNAADFKQNLFFIGALDWAPNQEGLVWFLEKCWTSILKELPETELRIAGRNAPEWMEQLLTSTQNINYLGEIDDAKSYIAENGIMIAPLLSGSGMRVKIVEGMMYQKAIVTTSIGCEGIGATNKEQIYIANDEHDFSKHCLSLLRNREKIIMTGIKAFKFVKGQYDNHSLNKKLTDFYTKHI